MNPGPYIIGWLIALVPVLWLGCWFGHDFASWQFKQRQKVPCPHPHNPPCEHRTCEACNSIYHQSWHDDQHPTLCGHCQGAT